MQVFTWGLAEELAMEHMRQIGFTDAKRTSAGADGGVDVTSTKAIAQVKHLGVPVGIADVQRARGSGINSADVLFYSSSGYTRSAIDFAQKASVALFRFDGSCNVSPVSARAVELSLGDTCGETTIFLVFREELKVVDQLLTKFRVGMLALEERLREIESGGSPNLDAQVCGSSLSFWMSPTGIKSYIAAGMELQLALADSSDMVSLLNDDQSVSNGEEALRILRSALGRLKSARSTVESLHNFEKFEMEAEHSGGVAGPIV